MLKFDICWDVEIIVWKFKIVILINLNFKIKKCVNIIFYDLLLIILRF